MTPKSISDHTPHLEQQSLFIFRKGINRSYLAQDRMLACDQEYDPNFLCQVWYRLLWTLFKYCVLSNARQSKTCGITQLSPKRQPTVLLPWHHPTHTPNYSEEDNPNSNWLRRVSSLISTEDESFFIMEKKNFCVEEEADGTDDRPR